ncbi:hypothetical protein AT246_04140 [Bartonella henselae]|nr:hypothetical protein AT241_02410 [Bartonella henselae]OLL51105.1 hypothetical protein AT247_04625 [Bartonella henselae]OLL52113.1 hypothetical protein AT243_05155 [Bartonella henselae]OLL58749.1 hypothetical protein AT246_04140 [Bartonella henselae]
MAFVKGITVKPLCTSFFTLMKVQVSTLILPAQNVATAFALRRFMRSVFTPFLRCFFIHTLILAFDVQVKGFE